MYITTPNRVPQVLFPPQYKKEKLYEMYSINIETDEKGIHPDVLCNKCHLKIYCFSKRDLAQQFLALFSLLLMMIINALFVNPLNWADPYLKRHYGNQNQVKTM